jgi:hypothetical protein
MDAKREWSCVGVPTLFVIFVGRNTECQKSTDFQGPFSRVFSMDVHRFVVTEVYTSV